TRILKRAKELVNDGVEVLASEPLQFFLGNKVKINDFNADALQRFSLLDDNDIISSIKAWMNHPDYVLSELSKMILNRKLLKIQLSKEEITEEILFKKRKEFIEKTNLNADVSEYFVFKESISNTAYSSENQNINIVLKNGKKVDVAEASDHFNLQALEEKVVKYYICYPKK
ncbi:MAG: phosphohydrolase, partial [Flavobacteriaceae bacterium]|nr:phosphohydrolase [Flavobacteriaceae bacterium]